LPHLRSARHRQEPHRTGRDGWRVPALHEKKQIRVLLSASTYTAIDNVLLDVASTCTNSTRLSGLSGLIFSRRARRHWRRDRPAAEPPHPTPAVEGLLARLQEAEGRPSLEHHRAVHNRAPASKRRRRNCST
jgi:hypothetical protein